MILEIALGVGVGYLLTKGGYLSNKGHRVRRNLVAKIVLSGPRAWGRYKGEDEEARKFLKGLRSGAKEGDGGSGAEGWDTEYTVPMSKSARVMSKLRERFHREIAAGKMKIRVDRNVRGSAPEKGNRGRRR